MPLTGRTHLRVPRGRQERSRARCSAAGHDPVRQRTFPDALRGAVDQGEAALAHLAYLEDRVRVNAKQPQLYGIQFTVTGGQSGPDAIEDPQRLDLRRAEAGVGSCADYEARMRARS
jgi:hypothetical protein